ncbi:MauE/DoxX family redox-associated membrane protein [Nocardioides sp. R1-1]|uniref:MauE/DoxX family redox-associated membrane protein n=1 Tax=Nocardioides sp. R1-1 TaxID=3383502 RepID=UPI0038D188AE
MSVAYAAVWVLVGSGILASGLAKLPPRRHDATRAALAGHGLVLPGALIRAASAAEVVAGAGLLATRGVVVLTCAAAAVAMMACYTLLVARLLRAGGSGGCGCHGERTGRLSWHTLLRNGILVLLAAVVLVRAAHGEHLAQLLGRLDALGRTGAVAAGLAPTLLLVAGLARRARSAAYVAPVAPISVAPLPAEPGDYVRWPVPDAPLHDAAGRRLSLRDLCRHGARLLLVVDAGRAGDAEPATGWLAAASAWEPTVVAAVVVSGPGDEASRASLPAPTYRDRTGAAAVMLGVSVLPSAVLLGADGYLAAGPAAGRTEVDELIAIIGDELASAAGPPVAASP